MHTEYIQHGVKGIGAGARYWFRIDGAGPYPDPASRFQPFGVHGPSQVVDPDHFAWRDIEFQPPSLRELVLYELHVGTFTPAGTFLGVIEKLDDLRRLGVNAVELMPIADFAGERNWGYDGVSLYAPARSYGTPDELRTLVEEAHRRGIAVYFDVVYNHLGPDGAYHSVFAPRFYSGRHKTPWGDGLNFDSDGSDMVRAYFIENAMAWIYEYRADGLRADATHAIQDDSELPFLTELTGRVHAAARSLGKTFVSLRKMSATNVNSYFPQSRGVMVLMLSGRTISIITCGTGWRETATAITEISTVRQKALLKRFGTDGFSMGSMHVIRSVAAGQGLTD